MWQLKCVLKSGTAVWIHQPVSVGSVVMTTWARIQKSDYMRTVWKLPDLSQQMGPTMLECAFCLCKPDKVGTCKKGQLTTHFGHNNKVHKMDEVTFDLC